jgi:hypothetical protein
MAKRKSIGKRVWLVPNDPDTFSYMAYSQDSYDDRDTVSVKIADCNRSISLYCKGKSGIRKLDKMIKFLEESKEVIQDGIKYSDYK